MNKCVCCGAAITDKARMCRTCYGTAMNHPCKDCTTETGRAIGCQSTCDRNRKWRICYKALENLKKTIKGADYAYRLNARRYRK